MIENQAKQGKTRRTAGARSEEWRRGEERRGEACGCRTTGYQGALAVRCRSNRHFNSIGLSPCPFAQEIISRLRVLASLKTVCYPCVGFTGSQALLFSLSNELPVDLRPQRKRRSSYLPRVKNCGIRRDWAQCASNDSGILFLNLFRVSRLDRVAICSGGWKSRGATIWRHAYLFGILSQWRFNG